MSHGARNPCCESRIRLVILTQLTVSLILITQIILKNMTHINKLNNPTIPRTAIIQVEVDTLNKPSKLLIRKLSKDANSNNKPE